MLMVFDDEVGVGQLPIVGCLVMKKKGTFTTLHVF
jgi:hypothetical protein